MMAIPYRYTKAIVDDSDASGWAPEIYQTAVKYVSNFESYAEQGKAPMFVGTAGRGKTYAAAAIINRLNAIAASNGLPPLDYTWVPIGETLNQVVVARDTFDRNTYYRMDDAIKTSSIAVFDDFAYLRDHPKLKELFWIYINARYDRQLPTIFTANIEMDSWAVLSELFGDAIQRRMKEMAEGLTVIV